MMGIDIKIKEVEAIIDKTIKPGISKNEYQKERELKRLLKQKPSQWYDVESVEEENKIDLLWDELEDRLSEDQDFYIEGIIDSKIIIQCKNKNAFHNNFILSKILGPILPFNAEVELKLKNIRDIDIKNDQIHYDFSITSDRGNFYSGLIIIKR